VSATSGAREHEPLTRTAAVGAGPSADHDRRSGVTGARAAVAIMRQASGSAEPSVGEAVLEILQGAGPGRPLPPDIRASMELALGALFGDVRIHTDPAAGEAADELDADAFTVNADVYFAPGKWAPNRGEGRDLIAHELAHTLHPRPFDPSRVDVEAPDPLAPRAELVEEVAEPDVAVDEEPEQELPVGEVPRVLEEPPPEVGEGGGDAGGDVPGPPEPPPPPDPGRSDIQLIMPPPPEGLSADAQGRVVAAQGAAAESEARTRDLPEAETNTADARGAVEEPETETTGRAEAGLTAALIERADPSPEILELCDDIRESIRAKRPLDEDEVADADPEEMAQAAGDDLNASVEGEAHRVEGEYSELEEEQQGEPQLDPTPVEPEAEEVSLRDPHADEAIPDPVPDTDVALDADVEASDRDIDEAGMTTEPATHVEDGPIAAAREARGDLGATAEQGPADVLAGQDAALASASAKMAELQAQALAAMASSRSQTVGGVGAQQDQMVESEEATRESVSADARRIFTDAQTLVRAQLDPLPQTAMDKYEAGVTRLKTVFRQKLDRVKEWIDERHSGVGGAILGGWDALTGLPGWVTDSYDDAEAAFGDGICDLITEISADVNTVIATCEQIIEDARADIDELFSNLPDELKEWARGEQARFQEQLDGLQNEVESTRDDFNSELSRNAVQAVREVQEEIAELREAAKGLIGKIADAIAEFAADPARFIINGLLKLVGISPAAFWRLIDKIGEVISDIADDPMRFVNNLVAGIGKGFEQFFDKFFKHLLAGFFDWLFSGLGSVGVELPRDFSLKSLVTFILQLLGLSWARVRELLVKHVGEENVALIEQAWGIVSMLIEKGPEGIFDMIKEQLDPQQILDQILKAAIDYVVETLIKQVTARVIALFNPAGAIVQAVELIYKILKWVFENAARIFSFVETVVNGMAKVLAGNIQGVADAVELALAKLIPPVIDFLAGLASLGDLPDKVVEVIKGLQGWVYGILDRIIGWLVEKGRQLLEAVGLGTREEAPAEGEEAAGDRDYELGTSVSFSAGGERHRQWIVVDASDATLMVASTPETVEEKLARWSNSLDETFDEGNDEQRSKKQEASALISSANTLLGQADSEADALAQAFARANAARGDDVPEIPSDDTLENKQRALTALLGRLFELFDEAATPEEQKLQEIATFLPGHGTKFKDRVFDNWLPRLRRLQHTSPDGPVSVFSATVLNGAEAPAIAYLGQSEPHRLMLPEFGRGADTDAFYNRAFVTSGGVVRPEFLQRLGEAAAARLRSEGQHDVVPQDNEDLHKELGEIKFDSTRGVYGYFDLFPDEQKVHPVLRAAVNARGIIGFLEEMVEHRTSGGMTWAQLQDLWANGGKNVMWMKDRFRTATPFSGGGQHEWIPSNYIIEVVQHAVSLATADSRLIKEALAWVHTHHLARSPTAFVIWSVHPELQAHVGALWTGTDPTSKLKQTGTVGSEDFHNVLRSIFDTEKGRGPLGFLGILGRTLPHIMWSGRTAGIPVDALAEKLKVFYRPAGADIDPEMTLGQLAEAQGRNYDRILEMLDDVLARVQARLSG
jgi:hypothetical protein